MYLWVYLLRYTTGYFHGGPKIYWWQEHFPIHEIGRIDGRRGFRTGKNVFRIGRNTFYNQKNNIPMKSPEFKRYGIGLIAEFRRIRTDFPTKMNSFFVYYLQLLFSLLNNPLFAPRIIQVLKNPFSPLTLYLLHSSKNPVSLLRIYPSSYCTFCQGKPGQVLQLV